MSTKVTFVVQSPGYATASTLAGKLKETSTAPSAESEIIDGFETVTMNSEHMSKNVIAIIENNPDNKIVAIFSDNDVEDQTSKDRAAEWVDEYYTSPSSDDDIEEIVKTRTYYKLVHESGSFSDITRVNLEPEKYGNCMHEGPTKAIETIEEVKEAIKQFGGHYMKKENCLIESDYENHKTYWSESAKQLKVFKVTEIKEEVKIY